MKEYRQLALAVVTVLVLVPGLPLIPTAAAQAGSPPSGNRQAMIQAYHKTAQALVETRQETIESNRELKARYTQFREQIRTAMSETGYDVEHNRKRLQELQKQLQTVGIDKTERHKLAQAFARTRGEWEQARQKALKIPKIQKARRALQQATLTAMQEYNSETQTMIAFMQALRDKISQGTNAPQRATLGAQTDKGLSTSAE